MSGRKQQSIIVELCSYNPTSAASKLRLRHDCYMMLVGRVRSRAVLDVVSRLIHFQSTESDGSENKTPEYAIVSCEEMEFIHEYIILEADTEVINAEREGHFVYEDYFNTNLCGIMSKTASFDKLKEVCLRYEDRGGADLDAIMQCHNDRAKKSYNFFHNKGLPDDDAMACAYALSFYTGARSEACNRGASLIARQGNATVESSKTNEELNEAAIILYYLVKALSHIEYYWGHVIRSCDLTDDELALYVPGACITWIQFSSSKKGKTVAAGMFTHRNTFFHIYSLTGRPIRDFSNYANEDEVLFLPHSTFIVFNHRTSHHGQQHMIYMRQVELGLCKWSVLWVDDEIFNPTWENKRHMEYASAKALNMNVHFIPKSSTDSALTFLRSPLGERLKNQQTFRIVTDMNRKNEEPVYNAGIRLIKALRELGYNNECLVFTSDQKKAYEIISSELSHEEQKAVQVTSETRILRKFVNFEDNRMGNSRINLESAKPNNESKQPSYESKLKVQIMSTIVAEQNFHEIWWAFNDSFEDQMRKQ